MNTSIVALALTSALLAPSWRSSYSQATQDAAVLKKPLVVVFGSGTNGWTKVVREQSPTPEVSKLLAEQYVCYYVDTSNVEGRKIAQSFAISTDVGMVISDRTGSTQAFWHQGDLTNQLVVHYLQKYSDPQVAVTGTETTTTARASYYQGSSTPAPAMRTVNC